MNERTVQNIKTTRLNWMRWFKNHFFTPQYCLGCAQLAQGCRELSKSVTIYELRIEEAREYLDLFGSAFQNLTKLSKLLTLGKDMQPSAGIVAEILSLIDAAEKSDFRLHVLNDSELRELNEELKIVLGEGQNSLL